MYPFFLSWIYCHLDYWKLFEILLRYLLRFRLLYFLFCTSRCLVNERPIGPVNWGQSYIPSIAKCVVDWDQQILWILSYDLDFCCNMLIVQMARWNYLPLSMNIQPPKCKGTWDLTILLFDWRRGTCIKELYYLKLAMA